MKLSRVFLTVLSLLAISCLVPRAQAQQPLRVVSTLSTFADLVAQVGGEYVQVTAIASPAFDPHHIEPKPSDVLRTKRSQLFVHAGIDLEPWRDALINASGRADLRQASSAILDLSVGVRLLQVPTGALSRADGDVHLYGNPHYWLAPSNALIMLRAIEQRLSTLLPEQQAYFAQRRVEFSKRLEAKEREWQALLASYHGKQLLGYHDSWPYLMEFLALRMQYFIEPKPGISPSPKHLEQLQEQMRSNQIGVIVQESFYPIQAASSLAKTSAAQILLLCQNVAQRPECADYIAMMDFNIRSIAEALS